jgi:anaerobic ribonucleoside-triphosphate reductase
MKIQKRDGRVVPYEEDKIREAIHKANNEVEERYRASEGLIEEILMCSRRADRPRPWSIFRI